MTQTVRVKNIVFQAGQTRLCVPLTGRTREELQARAQLLTSAQADIIEWRVDHFIEGKDEKQVLLALADIRQQLGETPLLFTFRSKKEGGEMDISDDQYFALNRAAALSGLADVIDIELFNDESRIRSQVSEAHNAGVKVIMSNHDFHQTPAKEEIIYRLRRMQDLGADLDRKSVV